VFESGLGFFSVRLPSRDVVALSTSAEEKYGRDASQSEVMILVLESIAPDCIKLKPKNR